MNKYFRFVIWYITAHPNIYYSKYYLLMHLLIFLFSFSIISCTIDHGVSPKGWYARTSLSGTVLDSNTSVPLRNVLVASTKYDLSKFYLDSIARYMLKSKLIEDSSDVFAYTDSLGHYYSIWSIAGNYGEPYPYDSSRYTNYLIAYKPGYKIWYYDRISDTLRGDFNQDGSPIRLRLSTIRMSKL